MRFLVIAALFLLSGCTASIVEDSLSSARAEYLKAVRMHSSKIDDVSASVAAVSDQLQSLAVAVEEIRGHTINANPAEIAPLTEDGFAELQKTLGKTLEQPVQAAVFDDSPVTEDRVNELIEQFLTRHNVSLTAVQTPVVQAPRSMAGQFVGASRSVCVNGQCYTPAVRQRVLRFRRAR